MRNSILGLALSALLVFGARPAAADPDALWKIVHEQCVPDAAKGDPAPCAAVDTAGGYAVLKDQRGKLQFLLIPTDPISGIENPALLTPAVRPYWQDAWAARHFLEDKAGKAIPRDDLALVVNAETARSQNQLHIHIDCLRPDVKAALAADLPGIGSAWQQLASPLAGHAFEARRLDGGDLAGANPFLLLAQGDPAAGADMAHETLAAIGAVFPGGKPGFVLLAARVETRGIDGASSETLLDHECAVLNTPG
jgi:CDP-diacylglycerol pyrophosphatase